ncbi:MAG: 4-methyl-5(b-hydroxyethyl)-thiazole monophosphate biosynthesis [Planctomycetota bacterium]|jgi:4-methyl-5(b-hydroxyethyl)-thiazole monophosphate biosynthesis
MSQRVVVPLAPGFEEIEAVTIIDVLRRAELDVVVAGLAPGLVYGAHGLGVETDTTIDNLGDAKVDMVALPGGLPGADHLLADDGVQALIAKVRDEDGWLCAICAAPMALGPSGVTKDRCVTSYPGFGDRFDYKQYLENRVVIDGKVITSRGPGTSLEFALELVRALCGDEKAQALEVGMLVHRPESAHIA